MSLNHGVKDFSAFKLSGMTNHFPHATYITWILEHGLQFRLVNVLVVANFIPVGMDGDVSRQK